jgi:hypothetical protein
LGPWSWQQAAGEVEKILTRQLRRADRDPARPGPSGSLTIELSAATPVV